MIMRIVSINISSLRSPIRQKIIESIGTSNISLSYRIIGFSELFSSDKRQNQPECLSKSRIWFLVKSEGIREGG
jgi:hypothetical protein